MPRDKKPFAASPDEPRRDFWRRFLWALLFPRKVQRVTATVPGIVLVALSLGVGVAAYNSASNILFITLALLLGCLVLSGVLSWFNFKGVLWWLEIDSPMRANHEHAAILRVRNEKRLLPTQALVFEINSSSMAKPQELPLRDRLDPKSETQVVWSLRPARRGVERVELTYVSSLFPFGFLRKGIPAATSCEVIVWPAPIEYRRFDAAIWGRLQYGTAISRLGESGDLLAIRDYRAGDSHRQIHWKASARLKRLVVRQFSAEKSQSISLWLSTGALVWKNDAQFETLCSFAATLAEDLFKLGQLEAVACGAENFRPIRSVRDLDRFLDELAFLKPGPEDALLPPRSASTSILTFAPEGSRGVTAMLNNEKAASA
ncbi:MAG: DUF58 domain-containing protein [Nibricoccus sp.]